MPGQADHLLIGGVDRGTEALSGLTCAERQLPKVWQTELSAEAVLVVSSL